MGAVQSEEVRNNPRTQEPVCAQRTGQLSTRFQNQGMLQRYPTTPYPSMLYTTQPNPNQPQTPSSAPPNLNSAVILTVQRDPALAATGLQTNNKEYDQKTGLIHQQPPLQTGQQGQQSGFVQGDYAYMYQYPAAPGPQMYNPEYGQQFEQVHQGPPPQARQQMPQQDVQGQSQYPLPQAEQQMPQQGVQAQYSYPPPPPYPAGQQMSQQGFQGQYPPPPPPPSAQTSSMVRRGRTPEGAENQPEGWVGFDNKRVRAVFVRKVYIILSLQLLFTMGIIALFIFEPHVKKFVQQHQFVYWIALAIFVGVYLGLICFEKARRKYPTNIILLSIFTLAMSYMLGTISSYFDTEAVFMAIGICAVICLIVSVFSFYTKFDFTKCGAILCILLVILILFGLIAILLPSRTMTMIYAGTGAAVFVMYLAYDTQRMMGGKTYEMSPEEHIFAAIQIYIDIVNIFMFLLLLLGGRE